MPTSPLHPSKHTPDFAPSAVADLRSTVRGAVLYPGDIGYDDMTVGHNTAVRHRPAVVVAANDAADVCAAVVVAAGHGLTAHVQATGHGATAPIMGGILISTARITTIEVDDSAHSVTVGAGVRWAELADACAGVGLALPGMASDGTVGVVGYTLGGGMGPMARVHGFAADHVRSIDVVTADGLLRTVDAKHGTELFWALLGGKFGVGIVTAMTLDLIPAPELFTATVVYPAPDIDSGLQAWVRWVELAPSFMGSTAAVIRMPDLPELPAPLRGQTILQIEMVLVDDVSSGERLLSELITDCPPMMSTSGSTDPAQWLREHPGAPPMPSWQRAQLLRAFTPDTAIALVEVVGPDREIPLLGVEIRLLGGALRSTPGSVTNSVGGRDGAFLLNVIGAPVPELFATIVPAAIDEVFRAVEPWSLPESQINFHGSFDEHHPAASAWPSEVAAKLAVIRRRHDVMETFARPAGL